MQFNAVISAYGVSLEQKGRGYLTVTGVRDGREILTEQVMCLLGFKGE